MKFRKKILCLLMACLLACGSLTACGSESGPTEIFDFVLWASYVDEETALPRVEEILTNEIPELNGTEFAVFAESIGFADTFDASVYAAYAMELTAMASCGEIDVVIMEKDAAARAARGGLFLPLSNFFTEEELAAWDGRLQDFEELDTTGQPTGTRSPICGIDLTGSALISELLGPGEFGIYAVTDMGQPEMAKAVITYFAEH